MATINPMKTKDLFKQMERYKDINNIDSNTELELFDITTELMITYGSYPESGETTDQWLARIEAMEV